MKYYMKTINETIYERIFGKMFTTLLDLLESSKQNLKR